MFYRKKILLTHLLVGASLMASAQHFMVKESGDLIAHAETGYINVTYSQKVEKKTLSLPKSDAQYIQLDFFETPSVSKDSIAEDRRYSRLRAAISAGWSYRLASSRGNLPPSLEDYTNELKSGFNYGVDVSYFLTKYVGIGVKYWEFRTKNSRDHVDVEITEGLNATGKISNNLTLDFLGPYFSARLPSRNRRNSIFTNVGFGYMGYRDKATFVTEYTLNGETLGLCWDIGYDIGLSKHFAIGFQLSYLYGSVSRLKWSDGRQSETLNFSDNPQSLSRLDLSVGLRFNK